MFAGHVAWQELVVEAALTGRRAPARAALAIDPLVRDPAAVDPLLDELLAANAAFLAPAAQGVAPALIYERPRAERTSPGSA